jgi:plasmid stabilization system protein ParE
MNYSLHPEASQDLDDAADYYRKQAGKILSQAFLVEFERSVERLLRHPLLGANWRKDKRKLVMARFPYAVIYTISKDELRIYAVAHQSRHPAYWRGRK